MIVLHDLLDERLHLGALQIERTGDGRCEQCRRDQQNRGAGGAHAQEPTSLRCRLSDISTPKLASSVTIAVPP